MKPQTGNVIRLFLTMVTLACTALTIRADGTLAQTSNSVQIAPPPGTAPAADPWRFTIAPLLWGAGLDGSIAVRGRSANFDVGFDKIIKHTDLGFMAYFEARNDIFGFYAQPNYLKLSGDGSAGPLSANLTTKLWIVEGGALVKIVKCGQERPLTVDALFGVRYWSLKNELSIEAPPLGASFNDSHTSSITDPLVGLDVKQYLTKKLSLEVRGDVGGFGIADGSSELSWQAIGLVGYDFDRHFSLIAGFRALALNQERGEGIDKRSVDFVMKGFLLGFAFHW